jgi:hypothetical protein
MAVEAVMYKSRLTKMSPAAPIQIERKKSLANEFARLRIAGTSEADALRILFDMVTTDGPVPEIDAGRGPKAS